MSDGVKRLVGCEQWDPWHPGLALEAEDEDSGEFERFRLDEYGRWRTNANGWMEDVPAGALPDLDDAATQGILLAILLDAGIVFYWETPSREGYGEALAESVLNLWEAEQYGEALAEKLLDGA